MADAALIGVLGTGVGAVLGFAGQYVLASRASSEQSTARREEARARWNLEQINDLVQLQQAITDYWHVAGRAWGESLVPGHARNALRALQVSAPEVEASNRIRLYGSRIADRELASDVETWRKEAVETLTRVYTTGTPAPYEEVGVLRDRQTVLMDRVGSAIRDFRDRTIAPEDHADLVRTKPDG